MRIYFRSGDKSGDIAYYTFVNVQKVVKILTECVDIFFSKSWRGNNLFKGYRTVTRFLKQKRSEQPDKVVFFSRTIEKLNAKTEYTKNEL